MKEGGVSGLGFEVSGVEVSSLGVIVDIPTLSAAILTFLGQDVKNVIGVVIQGLKEKDKENYVACLLHL